MTMEEDNQATGQTADPVPDWSLLQYFVETMPQLQSMSMISPHLEFLPQPGGLPINL